VYSWIQSYFFQFGDSGNNVFRDVSTSLLYIVLQRASLPVFFANQFKKQSDGFGVNEFQNIYGMSLAIFINLANSL